MASEVSVPKPSVVLLDIEGTTSSISFVKDILFVYVRQNIAQYLNDHWNNDHLKNDIELLRKQMTVDIELGMNDVPIIADDTEDDDTIKKSIIINVLWQMNADRKTMALKQLQGNIWKEGYESGTIMGHVYDDVPNSLERWKNEFNIKIYIYSSGSVFAQKLIFGHSKCGNLLPLIDGHFDTTIGSKLESQSYSNIIINLKTKPNEILFLTDVTKEAKAASESGMNVILLKREGNESLSENDMKQFKSVYSFLDINFIGV